MSPNMRRWAFGSLVVSRCRHSVLWSSRRSYEYTQWTAGFLARRCHAPSRAPDVLRRKQAPEQHNPATGLHRPAAPDRARHAGIEHDAIGTLFAHHAQRDLAVGRAGNAHVLDAIDIFPDGLKPLRSSSTTSTLRAARWYSFSDARAGRPAHPCSESACRIKRSAPGSGRARGLIPVESRQIGIMAGADIVFQAPEHAQPSMSAERYRA